MRAAGVTHVVMEVTSSALVDGPRSPASTFAVAAFSNLTQDHLDFHGSMEAYRDAKRAAVRASTSRRRRRGRQRRRSGGRAAWRAGARAGACCACRPSGSAADIRVVAQRVDGARHRRATIATPRGELAIERSAADRPLQRREPRARGRHRRGARARRTRRSRAGIADAARRARPRRARRRTTPTSTSSSTTRTRRMRCATCWPRCAR